MEVVNAREYYPEVHRWCLEKDLAIIANSDIHAPLNLDYLVHDGDHRPMTLVFAKDASLEAIREALFARRTAAYSGNMLVGKEELLRPDLRALDRDPEPRDHRGGRGAGLGADPQRLRRPLRAERGRRPRAASRPPRTSC